MRNLICAIVLQAVKDMKEDKFRSDAREFFHSTWFVNIAEMLDLDPVSLQEKIENGTDLRIDFRSAYH